MYHINLEQFKGPLEKLLELIEARKLEITQLNLALVTDDFLKYLESIKKENVEKSEEEVRLLSDFIVVASRLLLIKSKALLPSLELSKEEEEDIQDLEKRLLFYQHFKPAINTIKSLYQSKNFSAARPQFLGRPSIFYPPKDLKVSTFKTIIDKIFEASKQLNLEFQKIEINLIKLEEKISEILGKVQAGVKNFGHLIKEKPKKEIVVMFLALLHLLREQEVEIEQNEKFGDIHIKPQSDR